MWLRADRQYAGRGRQGRAWVSPPGNFYASTLVRLAGGEPPAPTLALVAAVALHEAVSVFCPGGPSIKWPNDLLLDGAKLSGILLERSGDAVVIGFGVNLAHHPDDLDRPATSLAAATGSAPDPDTFLAVLADSLARRLYRWRSEGLAPIRAAWLERAHPIGTALTVRTPSHTPFVLGAVEACPERVQISRKTDSPGAAPATRTSTALGANGVGEAGDDALQGLFDGLDESGALRLRLADGSVRVIHAADVFLVQD